MFIKLTDRTGDIFINPDRISQMQFLDSREHEKTKIQYGATRGNEEHWHSFVFETPEEILQLITDATPGNSPE